VLTGGISAECSTPAGEASDDPDARVVTGTSAVDSPCVLPMTRESEHRAASMTHRADAGGSCGATFRPRTLVTLEVIDHERNIKRERRAEDREGSAGNWSIRGSGERVQPDATAGREQPLLTTSVATPGGVASCPADRLFLSSWQSTENSSWAWLEAPWLAEYGRRSWRAMMQSENS
jgi:hypothetical protein